MSEHVTDAGTVSISTATRPEGGVTVSISGELDGETLQQVDDATADLDGSTPVVVDLTGLSFMDSMGLRWIIQLHKRHEAAGTTIRVIPSPPVWRLLRLSGLDFLIRER